MRIGDIEIPAVEPTRTGMYLVRARDGRFTGVGLLCPDNMMMLDNGVKGPPSDFHCFGPIQFSELPDKIHTTYKVEPQWQTGAPGRT